MYDARKEYYSKLKASVNMIDKEVRTYFRRPLCPQSEQAYIAAVDERRSLVNKIHSLEAKDPRLKT